MMLEIAWSSPVGSNCYCETLVLLKCSVDKNPTADCLIETCMKLGELILTAMLPQTGLELSLDDVKFGMVLFGQVGLVI